MNLYSVEPDMVDAIPSQTYPTWVSVRSSYMAQVLKRFRNLCSKSGANAEEIFIIEKTPGQLKLGVKGTMSSSWEILQHAGTDRRAGDVENGIATSADVVSGGGAAAGVGSESRNELTCRGEDEKKYYFRGYFHIKHFQNIFKLASIVPWAEIYFPPNPEDVQAALMVEFPIPHLGPVRWFISKTLGTDDGEEELDFVEEGRRKRRMYELAQELTSGIDLRVGDNDPNANALDGNDDEVLRDEARRWEEENAVATKRHKKKHM